MKRTKVEVSFSKQINIYTYEPCRIELTSTIEASSEEEITGKSVAEEVSRLGDLVDRMLTKELEKAKVVADNSQK